MRRDWTQKEEQYMRKHYVRQTIKKTAEALNRTEFSVKRKAAKMKLNHYTDHLSAKTLAICFSSDVDVVLRWIKKFDLPARKVNAGTQIRYLIDTENFWGWAEKNKDIINWTKYEKGSLLPEPEWIKEEINNFKCPNHRNKFTHQEKERIKLLMRRGWSYKRIAEDMGRTYDSINHIGRTIFQGS